MDSLGLEAGRRQMGKSDMPTRELLLLLISSWRGVLRCIRKRTHEITA